MWDIFHQSQQLYFYHQSQRKKKHYVSSSPRCICSLAFYISIYQESMFSVLLFLHEKTTGFKQQNKLRAQGSNDLLYIDFSILSTNIIYNQETVDLKEWQKSSSIIYYSFLIMHPSHLHAILVPIIQNNIFIFYIAKSIQQKELDIN